jgi:hypothetical protein
VVILSNPANDIDDLGRHILDEGCELAKLEMSKEHKEVKIDAKLFDNYVGSYELAPSIITVTRDGDALFIQSTGQPRYQVFRENDKDFFLKVADVQVHLRRMTRDELPRWLFTRTAITRGPRGCRCHPDRKPTTHETGYLHPEILLCGHECWPHAQSGRVLHAHVRAYSSPVG